MNSGGAAVPTCLRVGCVSPWHSTVYFTIVFDGPPDFSAVDDAGRTADLFQCYLPITSEPQTIIRAREVPSDPTLLRVREAEGTDPDPASGGWGPVLGETHRQLDGNVLTFAVPLALVAADTRRGRFSYELNTFRFGSLDQIVPGTSIIGSRGRAVARAGC